MSTSIRPAEGYGITVQNDGHTIAIALETGLIGDGTEVTIRKPENEGEFFDYYIEVRAPMLDGADCERDGDEWCRVCSEWFPKGTHKYNNKDRYDPAHHLESECRIGGCVGCETEAYRAGK